MSCQSEDDVLNDFSVLKDAVATVASLLVPTVGPITPIFAMVDERLSKSDSRVLERAEMEDDRLSKPEVRSLERSDRNDWMLEIED